MRNLVKNRGLPRVSVGGKRTLRSEARGVWGGASGEGQSWEAKDAVGCVVGAGKVCGF